MTPPLYILKLGGSIVTDKNSPDFKLNQQKIAQIVTVIAQELRNSDAQLILVHGAGSAGHTIAARHNLAAGAGTDPTKRSASITSILNCQAITTELTRAFVQNNIITLPIHTSSVVVNTDTQIAQFDTTAVKTALAQNIIPIMYGSMVCDTALGFSICGGDAIIAHLAQQFPIHQIFFATDVAGIFTANPHTTPDATHITHITFDEIDNFITNGTISASHHTDVTNGMAGKLAPFAQFANHPTLESITLFDGTHPTNFTDIFTNNFPTQSTIITK